ncbi:MAG: hypothetical protein KDD37_04050 [Bdellovibrionales bacterium]|nr:hypothetical protein [Bdellovibrionales bacterium]
MKKHYGLGICFGLSILLVGCAGTQKIERETVKAEEYRSTKLPTQTNEKQEELINYDVLEQSINFKIDTEKLGYFQKQFNTCRVGAGYSPNSNCRSLTYTIIHFRIRCRDTEGTTSEVVTEANLTDNSNKTMHWTLKNKTGELTTNGEGYGQIREVYQGSPKRDRLRISDGKKFLYLRANEITTAIVPSNWCN